MDAASGLVEAFLRVNGYLTLSEWQIQAMNRKGQWDTITDVDIVGLRFPGDVYLADSHEPDVQSTLKVPDDLFLLEPDTVDVIVGEVKEGEAVFNPGMKRHETLHTVLHRVAWLYADPGLDRVVADLARRGTSHATAPGGGTVRTRLVAFGQTPELTENMIPIELVLEQAVAFIADHDDLLRSARFANPVAATLKLLHKAGFGISRGS
ncbi:MAG: hypothetical protein PVJ28_06510 [Acidimicrobiia bacterium]|jgi:hypothetical protein